MEKYTVDIDKVLDDFEESEALENVLGSQIPQDSIFVEPWEHLAKNESKNMSGSKVKSDSKLIHVSHERFSKQVNVTGLPENSSLKENNELGPQQQDDNENRKLLDYEIFYKPFQSRPLTSQSLNGNNSYLENSNPLESNDFHSDIGESDSQDEILCVSVQENDCAPKTFNGESNKHLSHVNSISPSDNDSKTSQNFCSVPTENLTQNYDEKDRVGLDKNSDISNKNLNFPINNAKKCTKAKYSQLLLSSNVLIDKSEKDDSVAYSEIDPSLSLICNDQSLKKEISETVLACKENKIKCFDIPPTSCLYDKISGHTKIFSTDISHNSEFLFSNFDIIQRHKFSEKDFNQALPVETCSLTKNCEIVPGDIVHQPVTDSIPVSFLNCDPKDITLEDLDKYLEDLSDMYSVEDEDCDVSSQEDVNGNAFTSELLKPESKNLADLAIDNSNQAITCNFLLVNSDSCGSSKNKSKEENDVDSKVSQTNQEEDHSFEDQEAKENIDFTEDSPWEVSSSGINLKSESVIRASVIDAVNTNVTEKKSNFKIDLVAKNCISNGDTCEINSKADTASEKNSDINQAVLNQYSKSVTVIRNCDSQNVTRHIDKLNCNTSKSTSNCSSYSEEDDQSVSKSQYKIEKFIEARNLSDVSIEKEFPNLKNENIYETKMVSALIKKDATLSIITPSLEKNTCLPQKLQRPTTLDLPSRHVTKMEASDELLPSVASENSIDKSPNEEIASLSETLPEEDKVSGAGEFVKQIPQIGAVKPFWIPDAEAANCMHCNIKFTVIKRRHHCRACGKVLCSRCCNQKARLPYLQNKEDRICQPCAEILSSAQDEKSAVLPGDSQSSSSCGSSPNFSPTPQLNSNVNLTDKAWRPHPNNPDDYCSTIPPLQQIQLSGARPPPTVMVPIGVLKRGNQPRREPKQVIFSDGIRPGGDLTSLTETVDAVPAYRRLGRRRVDKMATGDAVQAITSAASLGGKTNIAVPKARQRRIVVSDAEGPLPPILLPLDSCVERMDLDHLLLRLTDGEQRSVIFAVTKNMHVISQITRLDCCFGKECWCFTSQGLCTVGQDEVMIILERLPDEKVLPRDIFKLFTKIYDCASKGSTFQDLSHIIFPEGIFGSCEQTGFLFVRSSFQCLNKLPVPITPFLVAILIQKWEVPWANVFPLRLMLRLGAECRYYPCALVSIRGRKSVYFEIGQTIMSVLADLRNYQFTIPTVPGLVVHMEEKKTSVNIPRNRYDRVMKVLSSNCVEHVLALGSNFSTEADSHLVCMQKDDGDYHTQAINIQNTTRRVTGASFIVFSGALKSSSGLSAKFSIVEDGLLVQIPQETMTALNMSLRDMKDLTIPCGEIHSTEPEEVVVIQWTKDDKKFNLGVRSPIDGKTLEGVQNLRIHTSTDYAGEHYLIRWTEVFFLEVERSGNCRQHEMVDPCRLAETIAQSFCMALTPYLDMLAETDLKTIGLRVSLDSEKDKVEYDVGACGKALPSLYMNALDSGLIPVILRLSGSSQSEPLALELIFHILFK